MSIENTLERIATALEAIAASGQGFTKPAPAAKASAPKKTVPAASESKAAASPVAESTSTVPKAPTPPPAPPAVEATAQVAAPSTSETLVVDSPEQCNGMLVAEYNRLGGTPEVMQRILGVMEANFNVRSVNDLTKEQYGPLITAVKAL